MMIEIELPFECCGSCPEFEAKTIKNVLCGNFGEVIESHTKILCENDHKCRLIARHMKESKSDD